MIKINTGIYDVVYTGSVITHEGNPIEFKLTPFEGESDIFVSISFFEDDSKKARLETASPSKDKLDIKVFNPGDSPFEAGNTSILEIAYSDKNPTKKLYLNFRSVKVSESRTIVYTFYRN